MLFLDIPPARSSQAALQLDEIKLPDGALLVSDDYADVIYRISYVQ